MEMLLNTYSTSTDVEQLSLSTAQYDSGSDLNTVAHDPENPHWSQFSCTSPPQPLATETSKTETVLNEAQAVIDCGTDSSDLKHVYHEKSHFRDSQTSPVANAQKAYASISQKQVEAWIGLAENETGGGRIAYSQASQVGNPR
ncbi:unnamed protein product [Protopolystoma xenopodis]|uniref:Uncharacterized protein n=1 Tax=Protopolystoma xenopodis TaxID=117903 RepID=A0A448WIW7_9PLAT|nr:unnamed protein product [Protopolystoma xenopodis]